jgi:ribonucleotide monophosphatase NagD (HAD superfamily)
VVVGFHREFDFEVLTDALTAVRGGALLIGSNNDPNYPTPSGPIPGGGAILAAVEKTTGVAAVVTGKPHLPMADLVRRMCPGVTAEEMVMVGDMHATDGEFARTIGSAYALVLHVESLVSPVHDDNVQLIEPSSNMDFAPSCLYSLRKFAATTSPSSEPS